MSDDSTYFLICLAQLMRDTGARIRGTVEINGTSVSSGHSRAMDADYIQAAAEFTAKTHGESDD